ncbi:hypothetical protein LINPERHAP1_LOCUS22360 [Linum perenne]
MYDFWRDYWVRGVRLASLFPRIAASAQSFDARLCDVCHFSDRLEWSIHFRYQIRGGALEEWNNFLLHLASIFQTLLTEGPASIYWPLHSKGLFTVASLRQELNATRFFRNSNFPSDIIWLPFIPPKFTSFCWKAFHKRIVTVDNLQRQGFSFANRCVMCYCFPEYVDHLFLRCSFVTRVWNLLSSALSFHGPLHSELVGFIKAWKGMNCDSCFDPAMKAILHAVLWFIWKERNDRIFNEISTSPFVLIRKIWFAVSDWLLSAKRISDDQFLLWRRLVFDNG